MFDPCPHFRFAPVRLLLLFTQRATAGAFSHTWLSISASANVSSCSFER
jgi:hypothetical protein